MIAILQLQLTAEFLVLHKSGTSSLIRISILFIGRY